MITEDEIKARGEAFWDSVKSGIPGAEMEHFFIGQGHVMVPGGKRMDTRSGSMSNSPLMRSFIAPPIVRSVTESARQNPSTTPPELTDRNLL